MDAYLLIAEKVLTHHQGPLGAKDIMMLARSMGILPPHLYGKTQHKTLQARLAEDILSRRTRSIFMRTEPGRYILRQAILSHVPSSTGLTEYWGEKRSDQLRQFNVLCVATNVAKETGDVRVNSRNAVHFLFSRGRTEYFNLSDIWNSASISYVRLCVVLRNKHGFVTFNARMDYDEERPLNESKSICIYGYVKQDDLTLFSELPFGVDDAARRIVADNLGPVLPIGEVVDVHNIALLGILTSSVYNRRNSVSLVLSCVTPDSFDPVRALGSSGIVSWTKYYSGRNDIDQFDDISRWSLLNFGHLAGDDAQGEGNQANGDRRGAGYPASLEQ